MKTAPIDYLKESGAIWEHRGSGPHVVYSLGESHSNFYFNSDVFNGSPERLQYIVDNFLHSELERYKGKTDLVCSYLPYGKAMAEAVARTLGVPSTCMEAGKSLSGISSKDRILMVADDIFTGGSLRKLKEEILKNGAYTHDSVFVIGNFSEQTNFENQQIVSALELPISRWPADECPMCRNGSEALNARQNWQRLITGC